MKKFFLLTLSLLLLSACTSSTPNEQAPGIDSPFEAKDEMPGELNPAPPQVDLGAELFTLENISLHNTEDDCWLLIDGKVYDVSNYSGHPGGDTVFEGCGIDATELFETRPMGSGTPHSDDARQGLIEFYIGDLAE